MENNQNPDDKNSRKLKDFLQNQWDLIKKDLKILYEDIKFAHNKAYKNSQHHVVEEGVVKTVGDGNDNQTKKHLDKMKIFWLSLSKKSKTYLIVFFAIVLFSVFSESGSSVSMKPDIYYAHYTDGSCTERSDQVCMNEDMAKKMCNAASGYTNNVRTMLGVLYSGASGEFVSTGGSLNIRSTEWVNNRCAASFSISGTFNGSSRNLDFNGNAAIFIRGSDGSPLIHYVDVL